ncbi:MAG: hypothetical protein QGI68_10960 [Pseudomonadales bacterium]|nr:hypothetical protein [Pseudomonadales bacterium]MDP7357016.1 hypothetical protein [Pseudomonadales bacterium]MDP7596070.1 hypothetical protein [Pseudomonadales bacterium]HJN50559.1 hypothetical protein [Pseudomonadales bacterium]
MRLIIIATVILLAGSPTYAQETPPAMVSPYDALADAIFGVKRAEHDFVKSLLDHHRRAALAHVDVVWSYG